MKKHVNIICFITLNVFTLLIFLPWLIGHYATDTYNIMNIGYEHYSTYNSLVDGRAFMFLIMQIAAFFNIPYMIMNFILLFFALIVSNFSVLFVKNIVLENMKEINVKNTIFSYIIAYTFIYNFMYIENLYFFESFVMSISIFVNLIAAKILVEKNKNYLLKSSVLTIISIFCYQGTLSSFWAFVALFTLLKKERLKDSLKNIFIATGILGIACLCNLMFVKLVSNYLGFQQTRLDYNIVVNIICILITKIYTIIYTCNVFYKRCIFIFIKYTFINFSNCN